MSLMVRFDDVINETTTSISYMSTIHTKKSNDENYTTCHINSGLI